jgi:hypothetical protein
MAPHRRTAAALVGVACCALAPLLVPSVRATASTGPSVGSCPLLPPDNVWNTDISSLPVDAHSTAWIASSGGPTQLIHPDWGPNPGGYPYGIPWQLVDASHQKVDVTFQYASESDPGPYPLGPDTPIEGGASSTGDRHALVVDTSTCTLYETWDTHYSSSGSTAGSGAIFNLGSDALRPAGWTSADAAGLPILPGLVRYTEVQSGAIHHAIRFTVQHTDQAYIWPARHEAGTAADPTLPPMGARFRLKSSVDISHFSHDTQIILLAMQRYGLILADNGSNWYFQGDTDSGWGNDTQVLDELKTIPAGDFEAVDESSLMVDPNSGQARQGAAPTPTPISIPPIHLPSPLPTAVPSPSPLPSAVASPSVPAAGIATPAPLADAATSTTASSASDTPGARSDDGASVAGALASARGGGGPPRAVVSAVSGGVLLLVAAVAAVVLSRRRLSRRRAR